MSIASVTKLNEIARKPSRLIIGLMSGTSLDGLDIALCRLTGSGAGVKGEVLQFETRVYDDKFREKIRAVFARRHVDLEHLALLNEELAILHAAFIHAALQKWSVDAASVDAIASHGQTVYHAPKRIHRQPGRPNATLQVGDGDHLAALTGIITLSDFRQKHVAAGGEGAPMAVYADQLLFASRTETRFLLNIGGIANFTFLPQHTGDNVPLSTDTGPGNTLINAAMRLYFGAEYDSGGQTGLRGQVNDALLAQLLEHPFLAESAPKTTGPEVFHWDFVNRALSAIASVTAEDIVATLAAYTARTIADSIRRLSAEGSVYVSGGGVHNEAIVHHLQKLLPAMPIRNFEELGMLPDAKEALLFALLANETLAGEGFRAGDHQKVTFGKISFPILG